MDDDWIRELRDDFAFVTRGRGREDIERRLRRRLGDKRNDEPLLPPVFGWYIFGREIDDQYLTQTCRHILRMINPEIDRRFPVYEAMFDVMDMGKFSRLRRYDLKTGRMREIPVYVLSEANQRDLGEKLEREAPWIRGGREIIHQLCYWLGSVPGVQLQQSSGAQPTMTLLNMVTISSYLHRPLREVIPGTATVGSVADFHYMVLGEELQ